MEYISYEKSDCNNGSGFRVVLWLSRCSHGCKGCFNKDSWVGGGTEVTEDIISQLLVDLNKPYIRGMTLSGGDPLHKRNYEDVIQLCRLIKATLPEKDIWLYTGYTYQEVKNDLLRSPVLESIDYLVDGKYEKDNPTTKPFRGSHNQVIHKIVDGISVEEF